MTNYLIFPYLTHFSLPFSFKGIGDQWKIYSNSLFLLEILVITFEIWVIYPGHNRVINTTTILYITTLYHTEQISQRKIQISYPRKKYSRYHLIFLVLLTFNSSIMENHISILLWLEYDSIVFSNYCFISIAEIHMKIIQ